MYNHTLGDESRQGRRVRWGVRAAGRGPSRRGRACFLLACCGIAEKLPASGGEGCPLPRSLRRWLAVRLARGLTALRQYLCLSASGGEISSGGGVGLGLGWCCLASGPDCVRGLCLCTVHSPRCRFVELCANATLLLQQSGLGARATSSCRPVRAKKLFN